MNTIKVSISGQLGEAPEYKIFLNGDDASFGHQLSRILTKTTSEKGSGIFENTAGTYSFSRYEADVLVKFENYFPYNGTPFQICEEIARRVAAVNAAFVEKYPEVKESSVLTLADDGTAMINSESATTAFYPSLASQVEELEKVAKRMRR